MQNNERVSRVKCLIARMTTEEELREIGQCLRNRATLLQQQKYQQQAQAKLQKLKGIPLGSRLIVSSAGDAQWPRGTALEVNAFSPRGYPIVKAPNGKKYRLSA